MKPNSSRIQALQHQLLDSQREISLERAKLYTESYKRSKKDESSILKRAKATAHILDHVDIVINQGELIVGGRTVKNRSGIASPEMSPYWILDELDTLATRPQDQFYISDEDKAFYINELYPYWDGKSLKNFLDSQFDDSIQTAIKQGIVTLNQTDKGQGHIIPSYDKLLNQGLDAMVLEVKKHHNDKSNKDFYEAVLITLEATQRYIERYASLAKAMAEAETAVETKNELNEISRISFKVAHEKPDTFYEALQLFWYVNIALQFESNASSISPGRFDQYMIKFYKQSLEATGKEFAKELLRCLWLKMNDVILLRSENSAKYFAGFPTGYTIILGGVDQNGRDATNELSYLVLETYSDIRLPQPNLGVRIHERSPKEFLILIAKTIRLGTGIPQVFNDEVIIPGYLNRGVSLQDARDYAVVGCVELSIPGKTYGLHDIALFNLLKILEITLNESHHEITSFDQLLELIENNISKYVALMVEGSNIVDKAHSDFAPTPLLSSFIENCIDSGRDVSDGGAIYNFSGVQGIGTGNLSDSLYVIKKIVFDDQEMSLATLVEILQTNFEDNEVIRQRFINKYDKYGNDIEEVDELGSHVLSYYCNEVSKYKNIRNGIFQPGSYTVSAHIPLGEAVGATPDGRLAKEQLADGGLSPMVGRDVNGPTAVLKSVSKLDNYLTTNGSLLNIKLSPSALEGMAGIHKFIGYLQGFMRLKIQHVQFNIVSADVLKDAQRHPEKHRNLVIRVAGYSAMFVDLNKAIQDDIIRRTEHTL